MCIITDRSSQLIVQQGRKRTSVLARHRRRGLPSQGYSTTFSRSTLESAPSSHLRPTHRNEWVREELIIIDLLTAGGSLFQRGRERAFHAACQGCSTTSCSARQSNQHHAHRPSSIPITLPLPTSHGKNNSRHSRAIRALPLVQQMTISHISLYPSFAPALTLPDYLAASVTSTQQSRRPRCRVRTRGS